MNKVTTDIMKLVGCDAKRAFAIQMKMMENGVDFSECTKSEFKSEVERAAKEVA